VILSCVFLLAGSASAFAQSSTWDLGLSVARIDYDLSGTGSAAGVAGRAIRHITPHVGIEVRGLFARPELQSGPAALFAPDVQIQYRWRIARFSPYVGGGVGFALIHKSFLTDWDATTSVGGGTTVRLTDRVALIGELRLRGFQWDYAGSTGEFSIGLTWGLPRL
jgi:opacity protein-like surface antigen